MLEDARGVVPHVDAESAQGAGLDRAEPEVDDQQIHQTPLIEAGVRGARRRLVASTEQTPGEDVAEGMAQGRRRGKGMGRRGGRQAYPMPCARSPRSGRPMDEHSAGRAPRVAPPEQAWREQLLGWNAHVPGQLGMDLSPTAEVVGGEESLIGEPDWRARQLLLERLETPSEPPLQAGRWKALVGTLRKPVGWAEPYDEPSIAGGVANGSLEIGASGIGDDTCAGQGGSGELLTVANSFR